MINTQYCHAAGSAGTQCLYVLINHMCLWKLQNGLKVTNLLTDRVVNMDKSFIYSVVEYLF